MHVFPVDHNLRFTPRWRWAALRSAALLATLSALPACGGESARTGGTGGAGGEGGGPTEGDTFSVTFDGKGAMTCSHTDMIAGGYDFCCPGDPICDQLP